VNQAVGAVAAHHPGGSQLDRSVRALGEQGDAVAAGVEVGHRVAGQHGHRRPGVRRHGQRSFQVGLVEHGGDRPARRSGARPVEPQQALPGGVAPLIRRCRLPDGADRVPDARFGQDPGGLVVEVHGPGTRIRLGPAFQDHHPVAVAAQQVGQSEADRAGADYRDVVVRGVVVRDRATLLAGHGRVSRCARRSSDRRGLRGPGTRAAGADPSCTGRACLPRRRAARGRRRRCSPGRSSTRRSCPPGP
jgi:hypothetical protein